jgi:hypothetical protein
MASVDADSCVCLSVAEQIDVMQRAASGNPLLFQTLRNYGFAWDHMVPTVAAGAGNVTNLKWALEAGCPHDMTMCVLWAAEAERFQSLEWLHAGGYLAGTHVCDAAALSGQGSALRWARDREYDWGTNTFAMIADSADLATAIWAHECGCPMDARACALAARHGRLDMLKLLRSFDCPWDSQVFAEATQPELIEWARAEGCPQ